MKFRTFGYLLAGVMASAVLAGCTGGSSEGGDAAAPKTTDTKSAGAKLKIAVIPKGTTHEFWTAVHAGAEDAAKELNAEIFWEGPLKENDRDQQIKVVDSFVTRKVDGIVLAPLDDTALLDSVKSAMKDKIAVDIIDSALKEDPTVSFVATDNFKGGQMAGEQMVKLLGGKGSVIVFRLMAASASTTDRENGFLDVMKKNPGIKVVSDNQYLGATLSEARTKSESALNSHKKGDGLDIDGIFCPNESTTFGTLQTLTESKWAGKVKFVGFDSRKELIDALKADQIHGLVLQDPHNMGYLGVKTLIKSIRGEKVEKRIDTGAKLVTKENLDSPDIQKLIAPKK